MLYYFLGELTTKDLVTEDELAVVWPVFYSVQNSILKQYS